MNPNPLGIESIRFTEENGERALCYVRRGTEYRLPFSLEREILTEFPEKYTGIQLFSPEHSMHYRSSVSAERIEESKLLIRVWAEDLYVGNLFFVIAFLPDGEIVFGSFRHAQFFFTDFGGYICGRAE